MDKNVQKVAQGLSDISCKVVIFFHFVSILILYWQ